MKCGIKKYYNTNNIAIQNNNIGKQKSNVYEFGKESEIERLSNERNKLLNSGMYTDNDRIIIEMDNKIKRLLQNN